MKNEKKLRLNKETLRNLSDESLGQVAGGKKKDSVLLCNSGLICDNSKAKQTCVTVCDTGIVIPSEQLSSIFGAFTQVEGSSTLRHGGAGLGLAQRLISSIRSEQPVPVGSNGAPTSETPQA